MTPDLSAPAASTPTGLQSARGLAKRRALAALLNLGTIVLMLAVIARVLGAGGWTLVDMLMFLALAFALPWTVLGFWNGLMGLWLRRAVRAPLAEVLPHAAAGDSRGPLAIRVAILLTIRNEAPARAFLRLRTVKASLDATGHGDAFDYFVLSDTSLEPVAGAELAEIEAWRRSDPDRQRLHYRRRTDNAGFKAGNLRDFCARWGDAYELMLPLDADSLMDGETILRMTRIMQAHSRLGLLQSLVVGMPADSAFARCFQFGMRHAMRCYTMGFAWWSGDCGPFWGHNALVRIKPFAEECHLPVLPGRPPLGGPILSHDQVEAALMRRAGFEVRVLPEEVASWEENPPTLAEFVHRDLRWCQGNLQYLTLLGLPGLLPASRFQLFWAILMFLGIPAWTLAIALLPLATWQALAIPEFPGTLAGGLFAVFMVMFLTPKLAGWIDVALTPGGVRRYGGPATFAAGLVVETVFGLLLWAISTFHTTLFMIGLALGRTIGWGSQSRDLHAVSWRAGAALFLPETLFGLAIGLSLLALSPAVLIWSLPLIAGHLLAIPLAVVTANPAVGAWMRRTGLCGIPEEFALPPEIAALRARPA